MAFPVAEIKSTLQTHSSILNYSITGLVSASSEVKNTMAAMASDIQELCSKSSEISGQITRERGRCYKATASSTLNSIKEVRDLTESLIESSRSLCSNLDSSVADVQSSRAALSRLDPVY